MFMHSRRSSLEVLKSRREELLQQLREAAEPAYFLGFRV